MGTETSARQQRRYQHDNNGAKARNEASNFGAATLDQAEYLVICLGLGQKEKEKKGRKEKKERKVCLCEKKKMSVYPQREPLPLSDLSVFNFIVGATCSVIYPLAL
jgi:hypothetical protein